MIKRNLIVESLLAGLIAGTAFAVSAQTLKRSSTKTDRFDFGAGGTVSIVGAPAGSITVIGGGRNEFEITAEIEIQAGSEADLNRLGQVTTFVVEESLGRVSITSIGTHNKLGDKKSWKKFPKTLLGLPFKIDYVIHLPQYCDLDVTLAKPGTRRESSAASRYKL